MTEDDKKKAATALVDTFRYLWRNAGTFCHRCGQAGMKDPRDVECCPHLCPHGRPCERPQLAPEHSSTAVCAECNARLRLGDVLAEAMHPREEPNQ